MTNENVATIKANAEKAVSDLENIVSHAEADAKANAEKAMSDLENIVSHAKADVEKVKAKFGHDDGLGKKAA